MKELWIYGIKNSETALVNAIQNITSNYISMPSLVYGGLEYRVHISDNSELLKLINSINKITGVMYTPERFTGLGLALNPDGTPFGTKVNPDGTPWSEIGYMTDIENPASVTYTDHHVWHTLLDLPSLGVIWNGSEFNVVPSDIDKVEFGIYKNDNPFEYYTFNHIITNFDDGKWYLYQKEPTANILSIQPELKYSLFKIVVRLNANFESVTINNRIHKWRGL
jgi:hypothetical protein